MGDVAIYTENISKQYRIGQRETYRTLRDTLTESFAAPFRAFKRSPKQGDPSNDNTIWALRDVSFQVKHGEAVGIIGHNGAGKSTLLKILSRITAPTTGRAIIHGRVGSLLEVGTGFNLELTGRENVFLNGAILGMKRRDIERKYDEIVEFSGIESFLDTPVKRFSTGMYMRLAFAVAAHLEPDILVVDEVLAVGDVAFQKKCLGKMDDIAKSGRTILFVSHNMASVEALCQSAYLLASGCVVMSGPPEEVIEHYLSSWEQKAAATVDLTKHPQRQGSSRPPVFTRLRLLDMEGRETARFQSGSPIVFELTLDSRDIRLKQPLILISIAHRGTTVCHLDTKIMLNEMLVMQGVKTLRCYWEAGWLSAGSYTVNLAIKSSSNGETLDTVTGATSFDIEVPDLYGTGKTESQSMLFPKGRWEL